MRSVFVAVVVATCMLGCLAEDESEETILVETSQDELVAGGDAPPTVGAVGVAQPEDEEIESESESGIGGPGLHRMAEPIPHPADPDPTRHDTEASVYHAP